MNPLQTAILRHTTTDGRQHFDWLLAQTEIVLADARETLCWRCPRPLTEMNVNEEMVVQAIQKHRGLYLSLDGACELSGERGRVEPVARGWAQELQEWQARDHAATARTAAPCAMTAPNERARCRYFILRFEGAPPLCVTLAGDRLTRVAHFTNMIAKD